MGCINRVILCGTMSRHGVTVSYNQSGTPCARFTLDLTETGQDGKPHTLYVDCECWGKRAEAAVEIDAGQLCLFEGRLGRRKKGETWDWGVSGFEVAAVLGPVAPAVGSTN
jgi:single-stranded DNA-binding protein